MDKFLQLEDVTLPEKSGVLKHKFAFQSAMVNKFFFSLRAAQQPELYLFKNNGKILDFMLRGPVKVTKPSIITNT